MGGCCACEEVAVGGSVAVGVLVGEEGTIVGSVWIAMTEVESSALTELTVNCKIGHKITVARSNIIDEEVKTTPRENLVREG
jgi:hypothetical protein